MSDKQAPKSAHERLGQVLPQNPHTVSRIDVEQLLAEYYVSIKAKKKAETENAALRNMLTELLEVADLRGDSQLPKPSDDPLPWTARMQDAWDAARAMLEERKKGAGR